MVRPIRSALLPAENGTMILMVCLPGHSSALWANTGGASVQEATNAIATPTWQIVALQPTPTATAHSFTVRPIRRSSAFRFHRSYRPRRRLGASIAPVRQLPLSHLLCGDWPRVHGPPADHGEIGSNVLDAILLYRERIV